MGGKRRNQILVTFSWFTLFMGSSYPQGDTLLQGQTLKAGDSLISALSIFRLEFFETGRKHYLGNLVLLSFTCLILLTGSSYSETDTLLQGEKLRDGGHLVSAFGTFKLGFFVAARNSYLGIWYNDNKVRYPYWYWGNQAERPSEDTVWVANRDRPIAYKSGTLEIGSDGNLMISQSGGDPIMLSSVQTSGNTSATLLDSGNLVLHELDSDGSVKQVLWEGFDYPTDTLLPGMKIGINLQTGHTWSLTSWIEDESPAPGSFTVGNDPNGTNQLIKWWAGDVCWASGIWPNRSFAFSDSSSEINYNIGFVSNENEKYFYYNVNEGATSIPRIKIVSHGKFSNENYFRCKFGKYPRCRKDLYEFDSQRGHVSGDGFRFNESENLNIYDCREKCLRNCSCIAFASTKTDINYAYGGIGCEIWSNITITASRKEKNWRRIYLIGSEEKKSSWLIILAGTTLSMALLGSSCLLIWKRYKERVLTLTKGMLLGWRVCRGKIMQLLRTMKRTDIEQEILLSELGIDRKHNPSRVGKNSHELQFLDFESVALATNNFASENKLGEGGFGPVYKGILADGQEVAIKRLSTGSRQGLIEFKNEVKVIAKLQHSNLVRLVGCCIEKEEKILIYEYMPNKSLDFFLFDPMNQRVLDWRKRFKIIEGIAQGLLYLHKYSRLKIIHRDLKASNILLDSQMNPKISDFGMAKIFGAEESKANTIRVVGTYGYMPPEYAIEGVFSTKSDVFSFGVLLLEIVSGKRNNSLCHSDGPLSLIVYAWELWRQERGKELIDPTIGDLNQNEALRCIHVGLLCVQEDPADRPSMLDVTSVLYNEASQLASPRQPAFYNRRNLQQAEIAVQEPEKWSVNMVSITETEGR